MESDESKKPDNMTVFICGKKSGHKCDQKGPFLYGGDNVPTLDHRPPDDVRGYTWGSVSCSICGSIAMYDSMW